MTIKLIDIAVTERHPHARIANRTVGVVHAVLSEVQEGYAQEHDIHVNVWAQVTPEMGQADIDMALMMKASDIIMRVKARLDPGKPPMAAE